MTFDPDRRLSCLPVRPTPLRAARWLQPEPSGGCPFGSHRRRRAPGLPGGAASSVRAVRLSAFVGGTVVALVGVPAGVFAVGVFAVGVSVVGLALVGGALVGRSFVGRSFVGGSLFGTLVRGALFGTLVGRALFGTLVGRALVHSALAAGILTPLRRVLWSPHDPSSFRSRNAGGAPNSGNEPP